jgi:type I restriction enzyme S subunit
VPSFGIDTVYFVDKRHTSAHLRWLYWALHVLGLEVTSQDTGVPGLARETAYSIKLALPPLPEQAAIAAFLDRETAKIDALVEEQRRLIELLGLDPKAPMKDSEAEWLGEVPAHWEIGRLKHHWSVTDCKHVTAVFVSDGIPVASIREVQSRYVDLTDANQTTDAFYELLTEGGRKPEPGDLIFTRNATVGEVAQVANWHPTFAMGQDVCLLRNDDQTCSPDYLWHVLRSTLVVHQLTNLMIGSTFKRVNVEQVRNLTIPTPPVDEQKAISVHLDRMTGTWDRLISAAEAAITLLQERRSALISAAVTGKIDVRGQVAEVKAPEEAAAA